jgi:hypothetical protein
VIFCGHWDNFVAEKSGHPVVISEDGETFERRASAFRDLSCSRYRPW